MQQARHSLLPGFTPYWSLHLKGWRVGILLGSFLFASGSVANSSIATPPANLKMTADKQTYNVEAHRSYLTGHVDVHYGDIHITAPRGEVIMGPSERPDVAYFFERPLFVRAHPNAGSDRILSDALSVYMNDDRFAAKGNVDSYIASASAEPFLIKSDIQEFDNKNKVMAASGNVIVDFQGSHAVSHLANVRMKPDGKAERVIFSGGAHIKKTTSDIFGDRVTVMVDSGNLIAEHDTRTHVDLKGHENGPKEVTITSDYQQYDKLSDTMIASGNVRILYGNYIALGPKATFKLKNNDVDKIYLTGRSTIIQNDRVITADRITIATNPKNFDAVGNVQVNFKQHSTPQSASTAAPAKTAAKASQKGKSAPNRNLIKDDPTDY